MTVGEGGGFGGGVEGSLGKGQGGGGGCAVVGYCNELMVSWRKWE